MGNGRSVCSESAGLHARNNGEDNGMRHRKVKLNLETSSKSRLWIVIHPHDNGIPSNRTLSESGEYVPAPCTHRPSNQSSRVWVRSTFQVARIWVLQDGLSRHKVAVGEPAAGSPPFFFLFGNIV